MVEVMATSFKRSHARTAALIANPAAGHRQPTPLLESPGHSWASLGQPLVGSLLLSPGSWCTQGFVCALQESVSPVLCKFWLLHGGVNGDLLQEGLCRPRSAGPRNGMGITEAGDIKKRWQEYTEELYKKDLQDSDTMMV